MLCIREACGIARDNNPELLNIHLAYCHRTACSLRSISSLLFLVIAQVIHEFGGTMFIAEARRSPEGQRPRQMHRM